MEPLLSEPAFARMLLSAIAPHTSLARLVLSDGSGIQLDCLADPRVCLSALGTWFQQAAASRKIHLLAAVRVTSADVVNIVCERPAGSSVAAYAGVMLHESLGCLDALLTGAAFKALTVFAARMVSYTPAAAASHTGLSAESRNTNAYTAAFSTLEALSRCCDSLGPIGECCLEAGLPAAVSMYRDY